MTKAELQEENELLRARIEAKNREIDELHVERLRLKNRVEELKKMLWERRK